MGYSPQKTPFDLTEFLSKPANPNIRKWKRFSMGARPAAAVKDAAADETDVPAKV
ncbi:hypothetical protein [Pseudotabrizicola sediminis]|uniref:hypothetical protein n=1 Tax=Pseudotabrizicola sediminis TaxID=2486418 RepID=UPI001436ACB2|nr:hypothetical protein [Pseudotabrizicola sediminis]